MFIIFLLLIDTLIFLPYASNYRLFFFLVVIFYLSFRLGRTFKTNANLLSRFGEWTKRRKTFGKGEAAAEGPRGTVAVVQSPIEYNDPPLTRSIPWGVLPTDGGGFLLARC